jgi:hypothetical protein
VSADFWKDLALWLIDCQAATAYDVLSQKSMPKCEKERHKHICEIIIKSLDADVLMSRHGVRQEAAIRERVESVIRKCEGFGL